MTQFDELDDDEAMSHQANERGNLFTRINVQEASSPSDPSGFDARQRIRPAGSDPMLPVSAAFDQGAAEHWGKYRDGDDVVAASLQPMILQKSKSQINPGQNGDRPFIVERYDSERVLVGGRHGSGVQVPMQRNSGNRFSNAQGDKSASSAQGMALHQQRSAALGPLDGARSNGGPKTPVNNHGKFFKRSSQVSVTNTSMNDQSVFSSSLDTEENGAGGPRFGGKNKKRPRHHQPYGQFQVGELRYPTASGFGPGLNFEQEDVELRQVNEGPAGDVGGSSLFREQTRNQTVFGGEGIAQFRI